MFAFLLLKVLALVVLALPYFGSYAQTTVPSRVTLGYNYTISPEDYEQNLLQEILQSPNGTFQLQFGQLTGQANPHSLGVEHVPSKVLVWYTYRDNKPGLYDNLGGTTTTLALGDDGDLAITVQGSGVDVLVWSSKTTGLGVRAMEMREEGNLVLLNSSDGVVWQSFDYPSDTVLSNQRLLPGKNLLVAARNNYPFTGLNVMTLESQRLITYVTYVDQEPYWQFQSPDGHEIAYAGIVNGSISLFDGDGQILGSIGNVTASPATPDALQRFTIENDGNMRLYEYNNVSSAWNQQFQVIGEACALPDDCGFYGLCIPGQSCGCPPTFNLLVTLNGCVPPRGLVCNSRHGNDFVKVPYASYFALPLGNPPNLTFKDCNNLCTSNCSCLGFFYAAEGGSSRTCLITHQMRTFSASVYGNYTQTYGYDLYVKVQGKPRSPLPIILGVCIPVVVIASCLLMWRFVRYRVKVAHAEEEEFLLEALPGLPPRYSYRDLRTATRNFHNKIGEGSFGSVYEGVLTNGNKVAVKQLEGVLQGKKEFHAEVATIGTVRHVNLVRLQGFCLQGNHRLLVYEHMAKGSLAELLFKRKEHLSWAERMEVAVGVARGLAYLHEGSPDCIIHCDVKPENILVDEEGAAKLSDFGLAKLRSRQQAPFETNVRGTRGYLAPEWIMGRAVLTEKTDVFSYGVVLLELLSGRRYFVETEDSHKGYLPDWALRTVADGGAAEEILDPTLLANGGAAGELAAKRRAVLTALWCVQLDPATRPPISRVAHMLLGDVEVATPPLPPPSSNWAFTPSSSWSNTPPPDALHLERFASSEVTLPFLHRASRFLFSSSSPSEGRMEASSTSI